MAVKLKHRWSLGHNYLAGITADAWWRLLRENRFAVDPAYWHRALFVTALSLMNSWYRRGEERLWGDRVATASLAGPPLFVLGHWRSGTTHLHNLLALDDEQFAFSNTRLEPKLRGYVSSLRDYRKNRYEGLPPNVRERVARAWRRSFEEWGYPLEP